jgi:hypothetical protein
MKLLGTINVGFYVTEQLLIRFSAFVEFKKAFDSMRREVL